MQTKLYRLIAGSLDALRNCEQNNNEFGKQLHEDALEQFEQLLPSGSGIDCGTKIDRERSKPERLVLTFSFHHMDQAGGYAGWTEHSLIVTPSLQFGLDLRITGRDRNGIKEYLHETYHHALTDEIEAEKGDPSKGDKRAVYYYSVTMREAQAAYQEQLKAEENRRIIAEHL